MQDFSAIMQARPGGPGMVVNGRATALAALRRILAACDRVAVAFSGGVDSTLLLHIALMTLGPERVLALYARSELMKEEEDRRAMVWLRMLGQKRGLSFRVLQWQPLAEAAIRKNGPQRCYHCKRRLFSSLQALQYKHGMTVLADGTNNDDFLEDRPGLRAAQELGLRHPLAEAGFGKAQIRSLARKLGLPNWDLPSASCLATRIPVGMELQPRLLQRVALLEAELEALGHRGCRARLVADDQGSLFVEVDPTDRAALGAEAQSRMRQALAAHGVVCLHCGMAVRSRLAQV